MCFQVTPLSLFPPVKNMCEFKIFRKNGCLVRKGGIFENSKNNVQQELTEGTEYRGV